MCTYEFSHGLPATALGAHKGVLLAALVLEVSVQVVVPVVRSLQLKAMEKNLGNYERKISEKAKYYCRSKFLFHETSDWIALDWGRDIGCNYSRTICEQFVSIRKYANLCRKICKKKVRRRKEDFFSVFLNIFIL